jgi:hypothetical protein
MKSISSKVIMLQGMQVVIKEVNSAEEIFQLLSVEDKHYEDKAQCILKYIDVLPKTYLRNEEIKQEYRKLKEEGREDDFRQKYCIQIFVNKIEDIQYLDDVYKDAGLIDVN